MGTSPKRRGVEHRAKRRNLLPPVGRGVAGGQRGIFRRGQAAAVGKEEVESDHQRVKHPARTEHREREGEQSGQRERERRESNQAKGREEGERPG